MGHFGGVYMATYLTKAEALLKLSPFGVKSVSGLRRLIREQGLPARFISPRKVFFEESEIDQWLGMRHEVVANVYSASVKSIEYQKKRKKEKEDSEKGRDLIAEMGRDLGITLSNKPKQTEAKPIMAKEA
jgi:hypothetical protein